MGGINPYQYANANPINYIDPYGLLTGVLSQFAPLVANDPQLRTYSDEDLRRAGNDLSDLVDEAIKNTKPEYLHPKVGPFFLMADKIKDLISSDSTTSGSCPNGDDGDGDDDDRVNLEKIKDKRLKRKGIDPHELKREYLGKKSRISRFDLYQDKNSGQIYIVRKGGGGAGIRTHVNIR